MSDADNNRRTITMRTIRVKLYKFDELSAESKQKAINQYLDINVDYNWWNTVYEDAEQAGLKINEFDIDRGSYCKGKFIDSASDCANKIITNHGEQCETFKTATQFISDWTALVKKHSDGITTDKVAEDNEYEFDGEADDLESEFLRSVCEDYRIMLSKEYDYLTSEAAIIESIKSNEYEFTKDGKRY
jgi:hypothetical protein